MYSWGVLHHTGHIKIAFEHVAQKVKPEGKLLISIYNDQGRASKRWVWIKKKYVNGSVFIKKVILGLCFMRLWGPTILKDTLLSKNPLKTWKAYGINDRGMSPWRDVVDWVGGYLFEVAKPEDVFSFFKQKGYSLEKMKTCAGGLGCNEFIFKRETDVA